MLSILTESSAGLMIAGAVIFILLLFSAFFSSSETALTGASRARLYKAAKDEKNKKARAVLKLMDDPDKFIGAVLFGNNLVNITASTLTSAIFLTLWGDSGLIAATITMTIIVLICAEILPKTIAIKYPEKLSLLFIRPLTFLIFIMQPFTRTVHVVVAGIMKAITKGDKTNKSDSDWHEAELRGIIDLRHASDPQEVEERNMLHSVLDLDDVTVEEIMTHRQDVLMINVDAPPTKILKDVINSPFTRIPIFSKQRENIVGVLHVRRYLALTAKKGNKLPDIKRIMDKPLFVPESATLMDKLHELRTRRTPLGVVVDEYGAFQGIVTLEDILEEIVGEIDDEYDLVTSQIKTNKEGSITVAGNETVRNVNRALNWSLPDDKAATIGGLLMNEARAVPKAGQVFRLYNYRFKILKRYRHRLKLISIQKEVAKKPSTERSF